MLPKLSLAAVALIATSASSVCQDQLWSATGVRPGDGFGWAIDAAGDVNGDGIGDVVVGAPFSSGQSGTAPYKGMIQILSGVDGSQLVYLQGQTKNNLFGSAVAGVGDVNADGRPDFAVGAPGWPIDGRMYVYSGLDRSVLMDVIGSQDFVLGEFVGGAGDVNNDGAADVWTGCCTNKPARLFSGLNGSVLRTYQSVSDMASLGDVTGDGIPDIALASKQEVVNGVNWAGSVRVTSGADGQQIFELTGTRENERFGYSISPIEDVNQDGFGDLCVTSVEFFENRWGDGEVTVHSGADGTLLWSTAGTRQNQLRRAVGAGDVDQDGQPEVMIARRVDDPREGLDRVTLETPATGRRLYTFDEGWRYFADSYGRAMTSFGDGDQDGLPDLAIAAPFGETESDLVFAYRSSSLYLEMLPRTPGTGDSLSWSLGTGRTGDPWVVFLTDVEHVPLLIPILSGAFDANGGFELVTQVAPGLSGLEFGFQSYALGLSGAVVESGTERIAVE